MESLGASHSGVVLCGRVYLPVGLEGFEVTCTAVPFLHRYNNNTSTSAELLAPSKIKWHRSDSNVFASSHDREVKVWDRRVLFASIHLIEPSNPIHVPPLLHTFLPSPISTGVTLTGTIC